jgi:hypothetical protein
MGWIKLAADQPAKQKGDTKRYVQFLAKIADEWLKQYKVVDIKNSWKDLHQRGIELGIPEKDIRIYLDKLAKGLANLGMLFGNEFIMKPEYAPKQEEVVAEKPSNFRQLYQHVLDNYVGWKRKRVTPTAPEDVPESLQSLVPERAQKDEPKKVSLEQMQEQQERDERGMSEQEVAEETGAHVPETGEVGITTPAPSIGLERTPGEAEQIAQEEAERRRIDEEAKAKEDAEIRAEFEKLKSKWEMQPVSRRASTSKNRPASWKEQLQKWWKDVMEMGQPEEGEEAQVLSGSQLRQAFHELSNKRGGM